MKRNLILLLLLPALFLLSGCENTMDQGDEVSSPRTFTATIEGGEPATKTLLENGGATDPRNVLWKDGDVVKIGAAGEYTAGSLSSGDKTAVLTGDGAGKIGDVYKGYYPKDLYYDATRVNLPQTQYYESPTAGDGNRVVAAHLPMYAESSTTDLPFKNLCAVLSLKLTGTKTVTRVTVQSSSKALRSYFTVDWNGGDPTMTTTYGSSYGTVTLDCSTRVSGGSVQLSDTPVEFCIAIPPGTYAKNELTVTVYGSAVVAKYTNQNAPAAGTLYERSKIYDLTADTDWVKMSATTDGHSVGGNYADGTTTNLNSTWNKE